MGGEELVEIPPGVSRRGLSLRVGRRVNLCSVRDGSVVGAAGDWCRAPSCGRLQVTRVGPVQRPAGDESRVGRVGKFCFVFVLFLRVLPVERDVVG